MLTFPTAAFPPKTQTWRITGASIAGPVSLSGETQYGNFSGGGRWACDLANSSLWTRERFKIWAAVAAMADNGATPFIVPVCDRRSGPFADPNRPAGDTFTDDTIFQDGASWADSGVAASLTGSAALRATQIAFNFAGDLLPIGGEPFSIVHASGSTRLYIIGNIVSISGPSAAAVVTANIRPPLREATTGASPLDFDNPRCQMSVRGDMFAQLELLKRGNGSVKFEEDFQPFENYI